MTQGVPGRLRSRIFLTFGITRVVDRQPYAPAFFTPEEIPGTYFQRLNSTPGHMVPSDTTGNRSRDLPTSSAVPQPLRYSRPHRTTVVNFFFGEEKNTCTYRESNNDSLVVLASSIVIMQTELSR